MTGICRPNRLPLLLLLFAAPAAWAQPGATSPKAQFGFNLGDDYQLANYRQLVEHWRVLDRESARLSLEEIGKTAEGRTMLMAVVTAPENHKKLARYKQISRRLALAEGLSDEEARALAAEGKAVVWIDGGLHATEVLGAQQLMEMVYQMVSRNDAETLRFLDDVILLAVCVNPDGLDLVADWYMRDSDPLRRTTNGLPRLYQKYIGHDNNRDFYICNQPESEAINRVFYHEWFPQIIYNHHQTGPSGTVLFAPPFRDPFNYFFDPLVPVGIDLVGAAMHRRFIAEGKPGATMRSGSSYSTWWNGGLRTTAYFHNMIGLLTESIGSPTPIDIPLLPRRQIASGDLPFPVPPQKWHFRQSVDYSITANRAVLDVASRHREDFLYHIYLMGRNSIERGGRDHWTIQPGRISALEEKLAADRVEVGAGRRSRGVPARYLDVLREPAQRDPRGYILPSDQPDFLTATKFVNALIKNGITVHRAAAPFQVGGKAYPPGSYVVKAAQAFRPHILDMFEPQNHPNDVPYPGGPPTPPYDSAGWTLAYQMGVVFDRILDGFDGPFQKIEGLVAPPEGTVRGGSPGAGYLLSHRVNDAFVAVNRLLSAGEEVYWLGRTASANGRDYEAGTMYIPARRTTEQMIRKLAAEAGLIFDVAKTRPGGDALKLKPVRIGLWDRYGGSMPSGWVRWLFEKFEFPFRVVFPPEIDSGNLMDKYDVLVLVSGAIGEAESEDRPQASLRPDRIPAEYHDRLGRLTVEKSVPQLRAFLEAGGTVIAVGTSTALGYHLGLPIGNALVEKLADGSEKPLARASYYIPGSLLRARVDNGHPLAYGMGSEVDVFFDNSPAFRLLPEAALSSIRPVAWFDSDRPLRSGWALGEGYLKHAAAVLEAQVGKGKLFLFGPEITFRAQPHGTFKFLFNAVYYGSAEPLE